MDLTKRYIVFAIEKYYPAGGGGDCIGSVDEISEIKPLRVYSEMDVAEFLNGDTSRIEVFDTVDRDWSTYKLEDLNNESN